MVVEMYKFMQFIDKYEFLSKMICSVNKTLQVVRGEVMSAMK